MKRAIVTPATLAPAALGELKDWLGITTGADDPQLSALLRSALESCEDFTGLMPLQQTCEQLLPTSTDWQALATRPVQAITLVEGVPAEGSRFALSATAYELDLDADGRGLLRIGNAGVAGRVAVRFTAGLATSWSALPDPLRHGVIRLAAHHYREREGSVAGSVWPPAAVAALWRPWRVLRLA